ncbi:uncharacterized protein LOC144871539 isoform X1 [Branchiostoma floridae x Branchiostoma japonicum]
MAHLGQSGKWCFIDKGPDGIDLKWISDNDRVRWFSDLNQGPVSNLDKPKNGELTSVVVRSSSLAGNQSASIKLSIGSYCGAEACGEHEDCFSDLKSSMSQEQFMETFRQIKQDVFAEWDKQPEPRMPLAQLNCNPNIKPSPKTGHVSSAPGLPKSPLKVFQNVASTGSRITRSPVKKTGGNRKKQKAQAWKQSFNSTCSSPVKSAMATEGEEEEAEVALPARHKPCSQESPGKSATEREDEGEGNPAKRQRLSVPKSNKKRDFQDAVVAMREALIEDMEGSYEDLEDNQVLPGPSTNVKAEWTNILHYDKYNQVCNNAKEYKLTAQLSKRCWAKALQVFVLCESNAILTKEGRAPLAMFKPLRGLTETQVYKALSRYAETPPGAKVEVKALINNVQEDKEMDKLPPPRERGMEYIRMKKQLTALEQQGMTLEVALQLQDKVRELEAENHQLRMFAIDVAQTVNSDEKTALKIEHIKELLEIDSYLDPTTGGFAMGLSLSKIEGYRSCHMPEDDFSPALSSTRLNDNLQLDDEVDDCPSDLHTEKMREDGDLHTEKMGEDGDLHTEKMQEDGDLHTEKVQEDGDLHTEKVQEDGDLHTEKMQEDGDLHTEKVQEDGDLHTEKMQEDGDLHTEKVQEDGDLHTEKMQEDGDLHTEKMQEDGDLHTEKVQEDGDLHTEKMQEDGDLHTEKVQEDGDLHTEKMGEEERWVAVALAEPEGWHIAKLETVNDNMAAVSFLQTGVLGMYKWPERPDKLVVNTRCVISKNVAMSKSGTGTRKYWSMSQTVRHMLNKRFKDFKLKYW